MNTLLKRAALCMALIVTLTVTLMTFASVAEAAGAKIIYQSPPQGVVLTADKELANLATLLVGGYSSIRVVAHVRASSIGSNKVDVQLFHDDPFLSPYASSPALQFPLWSKSLGNDAATSSLIDRPGARVSLKLNVNASQGETYTTDIVVYGFK